MEATDNLDYVLTEKTVRATATKVRLSQRDGWGVLCRLRRWHTTVTRPILQEELRKAIAPKSIEKEAEIADKLE